MICFEGASADAVWRKAVEELHPANVSAIQESRDQPTRELRHVAFTITDPRQRLVFARPINPAFAIAEVIWIMSGANDAGFLRFWNPRMMQFVDKDLDEQKFHGAYGFRLGSQPKLSEEATQRLRHVTSSDSCRLDQLRSAYEALQHTPNSRQVVLQIWDHKRDMPDPDPRSKDIPCNIVSHLMIRDGKLEWLQVMRSNDLIWGTPYNFIQFTTMQEIIAGWLGVEVGAYNHISDSLHVYERHWELLETLSVENINDLPSNQADLRIPSYVEWEKLWARLVDGAIQLTQYTEAADLRRVAKNLADMPPAYKEWVALLTAEALRRRGHMAKAQKMIADAGDFWRASWLQWVRPLYSLWGLMLPDRSA